LILVNDGSKDNSGKIADEYASKDTRIQVIHKENGGVSSARNKGIQEAKGKYICFIDSDDYVNVDFLQNFRLDEYKADFYISGALYDINGEAYSYTTYQAFFSNEINQIGKECHKQRIFENGYPWGKLFKSEIIKSNKLIFDEELSIHEDHTFIFNYLLFVDSIYVTNTASYHYLVIDDTTNRKLSSRKHKYNELKLAYTIFDKLVNSLVQKFNLSEHVSVELFNTFVLNIRLHALWTLFEEKETNYDTIIQERKYWKSFLEKNKIHASMKNKIIVTILTKIKPVLLMKITANSFMFFINKMPHNHIKLIYKDLESRSVVYNKNGIIL